MAIRSFSSKLDAKTAIRSIDNDAPRGLRQEFIDAVYLLFERIPNGFDEIEERRLHNIIVQSLGFQASGKPMSGFRHAVGRDVSKAPWVRFYDLIVRIAAEVPEIFKTEYRLLVNQLLASYRIAWEMRDDDQLHRVVPVAVAVQVEAAFLELSEPRFAAALTSFREAMAAYDARPPRSKDACKNVFDAVEAVAKEIYSMPSKTFGDVVKEARKNQSLNAQTVGSLEKLYELANNHFRHGMTSAFALKPAEVDYVFVSCLAAILLFIYWPIYAYFYPASPWLSFSKRCRMRVRRRDNRRNC